MKTKLIALSALSAAFATIFLTLGAYISVIDLPSVLVASCFITLPLYMRSYKASLLSFLASALLSFIFYGFNIYSLVFPTYVLYFGLYPVARLYFTTHAKNQKLGLPVFLSWTVLSLYAMLFYYIYLLNGSADKIMQFFGGLNALFFIVYGVFSVVFYFIYDKFVDRLFFITDKYLKKIIK